jgi:predicted AAA+ superfamily ATPase
LLDEITSVKNWPRAIKFLADAGKLENIYLLLTGSSAVEIKHGYERMSGRRKKGFGRAFLLLSMEE